MRVLFRKGSHHNVLFLTDRCNNKCLFCCQPPKIRDDIEHYDVVMEMLPLLDPSTSQLAITGGEPTLLGGRLLIVIKSCKVVLPETNLLLLSNGRMFYYLTFAAELSSISHPLLTVGIPLLSDVAHLHDYYAQCKGAFDATIKGILNLARFGIPVELRLVLFKGMADRLPSVTRFIESNLPFVSHVAIMGLEMQGYAYAISRGGSGRSSQVSSTDRRRCIASEPNRDSDLSL